MAFDSLLVPDGWRIAALESCVLEKSVSYGIVQPGGHREDGIPILRVNNFQGQTLLVDDCMRVDPRIEEKFVRTRLRGGEVLLTVVGSVGQVAIVPPALDGWNVARAVCVIRPRPEIGSRWMALWLRSRFAQNVLGLGANTTVQTTINLKDVRALPVALPPPQERRRIEEIVGALDDKIDLNRRMNQTLEAMARALYKDWFVDFGPERSAGHRTCSHIADQHGGSEEPKKLGHDALPSGWAFRPLSEVTTCLTRGISPKYIEAGGVLVLNRKCVRNGAVDSSRARRHDVDQRSVVGRELSAGDILVNSTGVGTLGRVGQVTDLDEQTVVDSHVTVVRASNAVSANFLGLQLLDRQAEIEALGEGSTGQTELSRSVLGRMTVVVPPTALVEHFDSLSVPWRARVAVNLRESRTLASLRDLLLPQLLSGALRLRDAEKQVAEVL